MLKKKFLLFTLLLAGIVAFHSSATAATIDLIAPFETSENDGVIRFGDQTSTTVAFSDSTLDYGGITSISRTFDLTETPVSGQSVVFSIQHYGSRPDLTPPYETFFSVNGTALTPFVQSGGLGLENGNNQGWVDQSWFFRDEDLRMTGNTLAFTIGSVGSNINEVEIRNFTLSYESMPPSVVPEPTTMLLFGLGLLGLSGITRKKI
ncbi:PEP-CTERM sorting domain-containing protein [uncultured Desulfobacter sp.]|uniref:PEP-CTERM sorting domain-containing protein n=1 Tax=uncultured Desulfobacter sp. TaxID=240139 RepID=UPI002AABCD4D|nr:PEP-CTERM sorting domain-containing protein [uncultured Desulfobacter sp.]